MKDNTNILHALTVMTEKPTEVIECMGFSMKDMTKPTLMMFVRWLAEEYEKRGDKIVSLEKRLFD